MYAGHFAAGLALKAKAPAAPTWGILIGVGVLDLLFGPFVLIGLESVSLTPDVSPGFSLDYIDWSHSLATSLLWSAAFGLLFLRLGRPIAGIMAVAVFSHFLLDLPMHPRDLALWPGSDVHVGLGLWQALPTGWWIIELAVVGALLGYYWRRAKSARSFGGRAAMAVAVVLALHMLNSPWLSPL